MTTDAPLKEVSVMVTRPKQQAEKLSRLIEEAGGEVVRFPVMEIVYVDGDTQTRRMIAELDRYQWAIFVSTNAVKGAERLLRHALPAHLQLAAVGRATAKAVADCWGREAIVPNQQTNSEGLLAMPQLQDVRGAKIIIFRGQGGRELLADELTKRGAEVNYAEVYRRIVPDATLSTAKTMPVDVIIVTSNEGLQNLYDIAGARERRWLLTKQLIVISQRSADLAKKLGFEHPPIIATSANDQGLLAAVLAWKNEARPELH